MGIIETILLALLGILLTVLAYVLFMPITVNFSLIIAEKTSVYSAVKMFPFRFTLHPRPEKTPEELAAQEAREKRKQAAREAKEKRKKEKKKEEKELQFGEKKKFNFSAMNRSDIGLLLGVVGEAFRLVGRLFRAPEYYLVANIAGGTEYPDVTGHLYGAYHAVRPNLPEAMRINYMPDYIAGRFSGNISGGLVVTIFGIIREIIVFIFRIPKIKLIKLYRKLRKGRKDGK
jgi:hypothetical protein